MNISEANAVNTVLNHLGVTPRYLTGSDLAKTPEPARVVEAARLLADRANRALSAGVDAGDVDRAWATGVPQVTPGA